MASMEVRSMKDKTKTVNRNTSRKLTPTRLIEVGLKLGQLPFKITAIPEQHMVQEFSAHRLNQALHERV